MQPSPVRNHEVDIESISKLCRFRIYFETKIYDLLDTEFGHCLQTSILKFDENPTADKNVVTDCLLTAY